MKRFQVLLFVLGAVGLALAAMLVAGILIGTDPHTENPSGPIGADDSPVPRAAALGVTRYLVHR